ncbi:MAG: TetR/AcrR family transcriptional regulator [Clostridiales bacterium]|nr:TetR/AcrR family transcriptional regulator [Clostridiales bacterium]
MSAKKVITEKQIVDVACSIVAEQGMSGLNMRELAKRCNCSTQPIYLSFANADELKREVFRKIIDVYTQYIMNEIESNKYPEYKSSGMAYIRFAKEQPHYFKYLFMRDRSHETSNEMEAVFEREADRMAEYGISHDKAIAIHTHMWVYVHGIATMFATGFLDWDWDTVSNMLNEEFFGIMSRFAEKK